jgi:hypothetical protein
MERAGGFSPGFSGQIYLRDDVVSLSVKIARAQAGVSGRDLVAKIQVRQLFKTGVDGLTQQITGQNLAGGNKGDLKYMGQC